LLLKPILTAVKVMPIPEGVAVHNVRQAIDEAGAFTPSETVVGMARTMLDELKRWAQALKPLRAK
jgi:hypothetical protein